MKKQSLGVIILIVSLLFAGCAPAAAPTGGSAASGDTSGGESINIGGGFALTGPLSSIDQPAANGALLAMKEINAAGGVLGKSINLVVHDSKYDMSLTAQVAKQFVEQDGVVGVIGFSDSDSVLAAGPTIQAAGLPFITSGATSPKIPTQIGDKMFLACFGDNVQAAAGAEYAFTNFGKRAYFLWDKGVEYTTLLGAYFKSSFTDLGGEIVLEDSYEDNATDFSAQIAKVKALPEQPDFYYVAAMPHNVGPVVKQMRDAGITGPIVGGDGYDTPDILSVAGEAANNVWFTTHALIDKDGGTEPIKKFIAAYNAEYGHDPENAFAALGYDAMMLMADAIKRAGSTDPAAIAQAIKETNAYPGITGSITYGDSNVPQKGVTLIKIDGGKFTLGAELVPSKVPAP